MCVEYDGIVTNAYNHLILPWATLQYHSDRPHQVSDPTNSDSSSEQLPHMNKCLLPCAATSPTCLRSRQETAA